MDVTPLIRKDSQVIQAYKNGVFVVSGVSFEGGVVVTQQAAAPWDGAPTRMDDVTLESFAALESAMRDAEVVLFGTGATFHMMPLAFRRAFKERYGIAVEIMDTGAASRTFNVLMAEGRRVMAVMLAA